MSGVFRQTDPGSRVHHLFEQSSPGKPILKPALLTLLVVAVAAGILVALGIVLNMYLNNLAMSIVIPLGIPAVLIGVHKVGGNTIIFCKNFRANTQRVMAKQEDI